MVPPKSRFFCGLGAEQKKTSKLLQAARSGAKGTCGSAHTHAMSHAIAQEQLLRCLCCFCPAAMVNQPPRVCAGVPLCHETGVASDEQDIFTGDNNLTVQLLESSVPTT